MEKQLTAKTENLLLEVWMMGLNANEVGFPSFDMAKTGGRLKEIINSLSPTEPATEKEPDVKDGFEKYLEETANQISKTAYSGGTESERKALYKMDERITNIYNNILTVYKSFSPVSQTTEEKLKSIISDKPSNWYEKALERKVKKLEAELSQTKGLDITDEEIDNVIFKIHEISLEVNSFVCGLPVGHPEAMLKIKSKLHSLLSQSKQETETNKIL